MSYDGLGSDDVHNVDYHAKCYVKACPHQRHGKLLVTAQGHLGICVEPFHLFRYLDEQVYRFNNRKKDDA